MTNLKSQLDEIANTFQRSGFTTSILKNVVPSLRITTKMEYPYPDSPDIARLHNPTYINMDGELWIASYPLGTVDAIVSLDNDYKPVVQALIDFYDMGEKTHDMLRAIGSMLFLLQREGFIATVADIYQINVGVYAHLEETHYYSHMVVASKLGNYPINYRIIKDVNSWNLTTQSSNDTLTFNSPEEAAQYILDQRNA